MSWTVRADVEAVIADLIYWACLGVRVLSVQPAADAGLQIGVLDLRPWMLRAMQARYDFPVECRQHDCGALAVVAG